MPYNFTPRSEEDLMELAPEGNYNFTITASKEGPSQNSGNRMATLSLQFYDQDGKSHEILDFLSYMPTMDWKIKHLCDTCGKQDKWQLGVFNAEHNNLEGWKGTAKIIVDKSRDRPQNKVKDYVVGQKSAPIPVDMPPPLNPNEPLEKIGDDDILF